MKKTKIIAVILVLCAILLSSCNNQVTTNSSTSKSENETTTTLDLKKIDRDTFYLELSEKDGRIMTTEYDSYYHTFNDLQRYGAEDEIKVENNLFTGTFRNGKLVYLFYSIDLINANKEEQPTEDVYETQSTTKPTILPDDYILKKSQAIMKNYLSNLSEYDVRISHSERVPVDYFAVYSKKVSGIATRDVAEINFDENGVLVFFDLYSSGAFEGITKVSFDKSKTDKLAEEYMKKSKYHKYKEMLVNDGHDIYMSYEYRNKGNWKTKYYNYKICTVEEAKAYSAKS